MCPCREDGETKKLCMSFKSEIQVSNEEVLHVVQVSIVNCDLSVIFISQVWTEVFFLFWFNCDLKCQNGFFGSICFYSDSEGIVRLGLGTVYEDMDDAYSDDDYYVHDYFKSYINYLNVLCILSCMQ